MSRATSSATASATGSASSPTGPGRSPRRRQRPRRIDPAAPTPPPGSTSGRHARARGDRDGERAPHMGAADHRPPARALGGRPSGASPDANSVRDAGPPSASQPRGPDVIINADRLRYEMAIRGMTAGELARLAGVNKNTINRALTGRSVSRRTLRGAVARAAHVSRPPNGRRTAGQTAGGIATDPEPLVTPGPALADSPTDAAAPYCGSGTVRSPPIAPDPD